MRAQMLPVLRGTEVIAERLQALAAFLKAHEDVWRHRPFVDRDVPWAERYPDTIDWLRARTDDEVEALHEEPEALAHGALSGWWREAASLVHVPPVGSQLDVSSWKTFRVAGRKRRQVEAVMAGAVRLPGCAWVDWCAGKGHLGRGLATVVQRRPVVFVERRAHLTAEARRRTRAEGVVAHAQVADVLAEAVHLPRGATVVALHACGALTDEACRRGLEAEVTSFGLVPCCYHHFPNRPEVPLRSRHARLRPVRVSPRAARFATAEEVVASRRRRARRRREQAFRLGVDWLRRQTGGGSYTPVRSVPLHWVMGSFGDFARRVAAREGFVLPRGFDPAAVEREGWSARLEAARLSLARLPFRRALELYLVLDRALWLAEAGYEPAVGVLCPRRLTPRNLWLQASI